MQLLLVALIPLLPIIGCSSQEYPKTDVVSDSALLQPGETLILANKHNITVDSTVLNSRPSARSVFVLRCSIVEINEDALRSLANMTEFTFLQNSGTSKLPENLFRANFQLENINLVRNNLTHLEERTFASLLKLRYLDVSINKISLLPANLFNSSIMLTKLLMQRNELKELPEGLLDNASQLKLIDLSFNRIKRILANSFKYNYQLEVVNLQGNKIKHLEYGIEHLNVKAFNLNSNPLDMENKKVIEVLKYLHSSSVKTGVHLPHIKLNSYGQHEVISTPSNYLLIMLISVTVLLSVLVGYLIYLVKFSKQSNCMRYNMKTISREDLIGDEPWMETEINGNAAMTREN